MKKLLRMVENAECNRLDPMPKDEHKQFFLHWHVTNSLPGRTLNKNTNKNEQSQIHQAYRDLIADNMRISLPGAKIFILNHRRRNSDSFTSGV